MLTADNGWETGSARIVQQEPDVSDDCRQGEGNKAANMISILWPLCFFCTGALYISAVWEVKVKPLTAL